MKIAIIGANGQLGSELVRVFGEEAIPLTHSDLDVTDNDSLDILRELKPDVVVNTAAYVRVDDAEAEAEEALRVNAIGALNLARFCNEVGALDIHISTDYVFDGAKGEAYLEEDVPNPINVYGLSKYVGEVFTRNYSRDYYIVRLASLYGKAGARGKGGNFVEFMIQKAEKDEEIRVVDDVFMSPTFTKDVAVMLKRFLVLKSGSGVYHMVNDGYCNWYEFTRAIFDIMGWEVEVKAIKSDELKRLARRPPFSALSNKKLEGLGLKMRDWRGALRDYLIISSRQNNHAKENKRKRG